MVLAMQGPLSKTGIRRRWHLPLEHGAWGMLYIPLLLGFFTGGNWSMRSLLLLIASTFFFLGRTPLLGWAREVWWKRPPTTAGQYACGYLGVAAIAGLGLVVLVPQPWLVAFGLVGAAILTLNTWQGVQKEDRTVAGEVGAVLGLTMTAPVAYAVSRQRLDGSAFVLWGLCILYFSSAIFYVKLRVSTIHQRRPGQTARLRWICGGYHLGLLAIGVAMGFWYAVAYLPIVTRALWFVALPEKSLNLKRIGWTEVIYSLVFLAAITAARAAG